MLRGVDLLARRLRAAAPTGSARTIQKGVCCIGACNKLLHRRCNEEPCTGNASLGFCSTEASKCTHGHPARGHHPCRLAAAETWCGGTKTSLCFSSEPQRLSINQSSRPSTRNITMCTLNDAFTLHVTLRPRLVTWGRGHSTQERVA